MSVELTDLKVVGCPVPWTHKHDSCYKPVTAAEVASACPTEVLLRELVRRGSDVLSLGVIDSMEGALLSVVGYNWPATNLGTVAARAMFAALRDELGEPVVGGVS